MKRNNENGTNREFVYLIQAANGLTKIGVTNDIEQRFRTLNSGSPIDLKLLGCIGSSNARKLERKLHAYFNNKIVRHEWFNLSSEDINFIKENYDFFGAKFTYRMSLGHQHQVVFDF